MTFCEPNYKTQNNLLKNSASIAALSNPILVGH